MLGLGIIIGAALVGAAWAVWGWRESRPDRHERYMREYQRAAYNWRHPRAKRHMKSYPAPLPLKWW